MIKFSLGTAGRTPLEQLQIYAKSSGLYDENVLDAITSDEQKISYLQMLASANDLALNSRLGNDYAGISDPMTKFWQLENEYRIAILENAEQDEEYQKVLSDKRDTEIENKLAADERIKNDKAISSVVTNKYGGDYSAFMKEYTTADEFFADDYLAFAEEYDEAGTRETLDYMQQLADSVQTNQELALLYARRAKLNQAIAADKLDQMKRKAYEDASWVEKFASSVLQIGAAPVTELGNIMEGIIDACALLGTVFTDDTTDKVLMNYVAQDTIAWDTLLAECVPNSFITSPYADDNPLKWVYNIETSIIDMAPMALNTVVPVLGTIIYYASSAGRTGESYLLENPQASVSEVLAYSASVTVIEALTERINADAVFGKGFFGKYVKATDFSARRMLVQGFAEGVEEFASEIGSQYVSSIMTGENKFDIKQAFVAAAYGAATGMIMECGSTTMVRRRMFGIGTKITSSSGNSVTLNLKDSTILEDFMTKSEAKLNDGKTLSKRDQDLYDKFKVLDRSDVIVEDVKFDRNEQLKSANVVYNKKQQTTETQTPDTEAVNIPETSETAEVKNLYNQLVESVKLGEDYSDISEQIIPEVEAVRMQAEMSTMAALWANNLLTAADENAQTIVEAAAEYYYGELDRILNTIDIPVVQNLAEQKVLRNTLGISAQIVRPDTTDAKTTMRLLESTMRNISAKTYKIQVYVTDSKIAPIVSIIDNTIYVNAKFLSVAFSSSLIKSLEMEYITIEQYNTISPDTRLYLNELVNKLYSDIGTFARAEHLAQQLLRTALFDIQSDLLVQLSELDHNGFGRLKALLETQVKSSNLQVRNIAYTGMLVYDTTLLKRMSEDEATERKLLSGNYSIDALKQLVRERSILHKKFKYGIDMSTAGVKLLSAVRHLQREFGFETDASNIYRVLLDIRRYDKYQNKAALRQICNIYNASFSTAINRYLSDQFDFEIDGSGTIVNTANIERLIDDDKLRALWQRGVSQYTPLRSLTTSLGKTVFGNDCLFAIVENVPNAAGVFSNSTNGISLIQAEYVGDYSKFKTVSVHEIQHYLATTAHLSSSPAASVFNPGSLRSIADSLSESERSSFHQNIRNLLIDYGETETTVNSMTIPQLYQELLSWVYINLDLEETRANFSDTEDIIFTTTVVDDDLIHVHTKIPAKTSLTNIEYEVLKYFDGLTMTFTSQNDHVQDTIGRIIGGTATLDDVMKDGLNANFVPIEPNAMRTAPDILSRLKDFAFGDDKPTDADLCSPIYLASKLIDENLRNRVLQWTPEQCKQQISRLTGLVFDEYTGTFVEPGKTPKLGEYIKFRGNDAIIINKQDSTVLQLPRDYSVGKYPDLDEALRNVKPSTNVKYFVDDRLFSNLSEAALYTDTRAIKAAKRPGSTDNAQFMEFDKLIDNIPANGFRAEHDFVFVTHDDKVFSADTDGKPGELFKNLAKRLGVKFNLLSTGMTVDQKTGQYTGNLENELMTKLFDAKKVVRAYFNGEQWEAFGKPNWVQDNLLRQLGTVSNSRGYLLPEDSNYSSYLPGTTKLVVNEKGKVGIDRTGTSGRPEVSWKTNTWYASICQIIEKYDIRKISEFKDLGFNEAFIESMTKNFGRAVQGKTVGKLGITETTAKTIRDNAGLEQRVITDFINDDSASVFARNILIQNAPERVSTDNLNWQTAAHIRSVEDAGDYLRAIITYSGTLLRTKNTKKYNSLNELIYDCKQAYIESDAQRSLLVAELFNSSKTDNIKLANIISEFLNLDSRQRGKAGRTFAMQGLDYSIEGFNAAAGIIRRGFTKSTKSADEKPGATVPLESTVQGRHADDTEDVNVLDTDSGTIRKSEGTTAEAQAINVENEKLINWFKREVNRASKLAKSKTQYDKFLSQIKAKLEVENQRYIDEIDEPDPAHTALIAKLNEMIRADATEETGVKAVIDAALDRIENAADKAAQQDTEYQLITSKAQVLRKQYGEKGYKQLLEALGTKAVFGGATGLSNVNSNISKRLAGTGSASIDARIDKLITEPAVNARLKGLTDVLRKFKDYFAGIPNTAEGYTSMRFKYSNLLTNYYNFVQTFAATRDSSKFAEVKSSYKEIADYLDSFVLDGNFDFNKVYPEYGPWVDYSEKLISGTFDEPEFVAFNNLSFDDRIAMLKSWIEAGIDSGYPKLVIDRMQRILEDALPPQIEPLMLKKPAKPAKPAINMNILVKARNDANLSAESTAALEAAITEANNRYKTAKDTKHDVAKATAAVRAASTAAFNSKYILWSYERLNREYRKYANSPAITTADAEKLIKYAADIIRNFDFQTNKNLWREKFKKEWNDDKSAWVMEHKAFIYYDRKGKFPKAYEDKFSKLSKDEIKRRIGEARFERNKYINDRVNALRELVKQKSYTGTKFETTTKALYADDTADSAKSKRFNFATAKSVDDLLKMFAENTVKFDTELGKAYKELGLTPETETVHSSLSDIVNHVAEQEAIQLKKPPESRRVVENQALNNIINGVSIALTEFQYRPMTMASAIKFIIDVRTVLQDRALNKSLFSWKNNVTVNKDTHYSSLEALSKYNSKFEVGSLASFNALMDYLDSGNFVSRVSEIEAAMANDADAVSGVINTYLEEYKEATLTEEDTDLDSELSQTMRYATDKGDSDDGINFISEEDIPQILPNMLLRDENFDFTDDDLEVSDEAFDSTEETDEDLELSDEIIPPIKKPDEKPTNSRKSSKRDNRTVEEQFPGFDKDASRSSYKTVKSELLTRNGVDLETALNYEFSKTETVDVMGVTHDRQIISTEEFINNPVIADIMHKLRNSEAAIKDFLTWLREAKSISADVQLKAIIILNRIIAIPGLKFDLLREARVLRSEVKSIAGTILALGEKHGLTPAEEICALASNLFELTEEDVENISSLVNKQDLAIRAQDFAAADEIMQEALKIFEKYKDQLDTSINPFTTKDPEERAIRWKNLSNKITSWRYFAMLSAPSTFWAKNYAGNYVAKGFNSVASTLAAEVQKFVDKKYTNRYTRTNKPISETAKTAVTKKLIDNGLLNGILDNTVAKYDTGYEYKPNSLRNITKRINSAADLTPENIASLNQMLSAKTPFGTSDNPVVKVLNTYYGIIFNTMNNADRKFVSSEIVRLTERLVSDNFSNAEISELNSENTSEALSAKFHSIVDYARQQALTTYFRSTPAVYNTLMSMFNKYPVAQAIFSVICPFPRMVFNTTMTALAYSPIGFVQAAMTLKNDQSIFANITASQQFAKAATGSVAMLVGAMLAALGAIKIDEEDKYSGPQVVIFDTLRISLEGLEPTATPFIVGSMFVLGPQTSEEINAFTAAAQTLLDTTILGELMSQFGQGKTSTEWVGDTFSSYVTQFIPTILKRTTQVIDPAKKDYTGGFEMFKRIGAALPGVSYLVPDKIDPYTGNPQVQYTDSNNAFVSRLLVIFNAISPTKVSLNNDSAVEKESRAVGATTTGPARTITVNGVEHKLSKKQYNDYKILRAKLYSKYANEIINTPAYQKLTTEQKQAKLRRLQDKATKEARKQLNLP